MKKEEKMKRVMILASPCEKRQGVFMEVGLDRSNSMGMGVL
jgi:hypothetical protein